jgi:hypothetical protein
MESKGFPRASLAVVPFQVFANNRLSTAARARQCSGSAMLCFSPPCNQG